MQTLAQSIASFVIQGCLSQRFVGYSFKIESPRKKELLSLQLCLQNDRFLPLTRKISEHRWTDHIGQPRSSKVLQEVPTAHSSLEIFSSLFFLMELNSCTLPYCSGHEWSFSSLLPWWVQFLFDINKIQEHNNYAKKQTKNNTMLLYVYYKQLDIEINCHNIVM